MITHEFKTSQNVVKYGMPASAIPYQATIQLIFGFIANLINRPAQINRIGMPGNIRFNISGQRKTVHYKHQSNQQTG
jgi:hypothetical protein